MDERDLRELVLRCSEEIRRHGRVRIHDEKDVLLVAEFADGYTAAKNVRSVENRFVVKYTTDWKSDFVVSGPYDYIDRTPIERFLVGNLQMAQFVLGFLRKSQVLDDLADV